MSAAIHTEAAPANGWRIKFKQGADWYPIDPEFSTFDAAWTALDLLHKGDADQPVERRVVKSFD